MTLKDQIQADLIAAMKAQDELKKGALRMLKAAIMKWETEGEKRVADDAAVLQIIQREVKGRRDAAEAFAKGGNAEMATKEEDEMKFLLTYMPAQMSEEEVRAEVSGILSEAGITGKADMGKAMGLVMGRLKGKADGGVINKVVGEMLK